MNMNERHDDDLDPALAQVLTDALRAGMDVEVATRHLWRLREEARRMAEESVPAPAGAHRQRVAALLSTVLLFVTSGIAVAGSGHAQPGELLYPVKRGAERVQLLATWDATADAELSLRFARTRLAEAETVSVVDPSWGQRLIAEAVRSIDRAEARGGPAVAQEAAQIREEAGHRLVALTDPKPPAGEVAQVTEDQPAQDEADRTGSVEDPISEVRPERQPAREVAEVPPPRIAAGRLDGTAAAEHADPSPPDAPTSEDGREKPKSAPPPVTSSTPPDEDEDAPQAADDADEPAAGGELPPPEEESTAKRVPSSSELAARFDARTEPSDP